MNNVFDRLFDPNAVPEFKWELTPHQMVERVRQAVLQKGDPNASLDSIFDQRKENAPLPSQSHSKSVLAAMVEMGYVSAVEWLLNQGASTDLRPDQPCNLIALAINGKSQSKYMAQKLIGHGCLFLQEETQTKASARLSEYYQQIDDLANQNILDMIHVLARHGLKCDPETLEQENRTRLAWKDKVHLRPDEEDPIEAMVQDVRHSQQGSEPNELCKALIVLGASPAPALARWRTPNPAFQQQVLDFLEKCQALCDRQTITTTIDHHGPSSSPLKRM